MHTQCNYTTSSTTLDSDVEKLNDSYPREWIGEDIVLELVNKLQHEVADAACVISCEPWPELCAAS